MNSALSISSLEQRQHQAAQETLSTQNGEFLTRMHRFLVTCGWRRTQDRRQSAMFIKQYERDQRVITLTGWHGGGRPGTSRNYGSLRLLFGLGDNQPEGRGPRELLARERFSLDIVHGTVADAEAFLTRAEQYILNTCKG